MESIEIAGKTEEEAIKKALEQLGMTEDQVTITILKKAKGGILGLGAEEAVVRIEPKLQIHDEANNESQSQIDDVLLSTTITEAKEILEILLSTMKINASVEIVPGPTVTDSEEKPTLSLDIHIKDEDLGLLIGRRGQNLATLQYMVNLILSSNKRIQSPVLVDIEGYKKRRYNALQNIVLRLAEQVRTNRQSVIMEPMPANERRIIHLSLDKMPDIATESTGEGDNRKVVIKYREQ